MDCSPSISRSAFHAVRWSGTWANLSHDSCCSSIFVVNGLSYVQKDSTISTYFPILAALGIVFTKIRSNFEKLNIRGSNRIVFEDSLILPMTMAEFLPDLFLVFTLLGKLGQLFRLHIDTLWSFEYLSFNCQPIQKSSHPWG